jgi:hypothetical protein
VAIGTVMISCYAGAGVMLLVALSGTEGTRICERANADVVHSQLMQVHMTTVTVEIDIFSGRPNPDWTLSEADAAVFLSKLSGLQKTAARPRSANLGYRGLVVRMPQEAGRRIYIQKGVIESSDGTSSTFCLDPQRSLEHWLIGIGRKFLSHEVLEAIDADLQK